MNYSNTTMRPNQLVTPQIPSYNQYQTPVSQPIFPQPSGNVYMVNNNLEVANIPIGVGMSAVLYSVFPSDGKDNSNYFAVYTTINSIIGVVCTFIAGFIMDVLQKNNIVLLGTHIYAQQILCVLGTLGIIVTLIYLNKGCKMLDKKIED